MEGSIEVLKEFRYIAQIFALYNRENFKVSDRKNMRQQYFGGFYICNTARLPWIVDCFCRMAQFRLQFCYKQNSFRPSCVLSCSANLFNILYTGCK